MKRVVDADKVFEKILKLKERARNFRDDRNSNLTSEEWKFYDGIASGLELAEQAVVEELDAKG
jgi:hypothetical protein